MSTAETKAPKGGRFVAWSGFLFGSVLSIGGNILFTWMPHPPEGASATWAPPADWAPSPWAQIGAAAWSVALLISVEVMSRVRWPNRWTWNLARYGGISLVALGSAIISYGHLSHVLTEWDYGFGAYIGPLVIDGLMTLCGFAILADGIEPSPAGVGEELAPKQWVVADIEKKADGHTVEHVVEVPAPVVPAAPKRQAPQAPAAEQPVDEDKVRDLIANGIGRRALAKELNITPHKARRLLEQHSEPHSVNGHQVVPS